MAGYGLLITNTVWDDLDFPILPRSTGTTVASYASIDYCLGSSQVSSK